jgi:pimeloyl-ACP methyl ester carboxylesterase
MNDMSVAAALVAEPPAGLREAGSGPGVVCLHANASSSRQWRGLMERLAPSHHVLAPDLHDAGEGPCWTAGRPIRLRDEVERLQPVLARAGERPAIVGHSYGAAVALVAALAKPERVRALALYEPVLFSLIDAEQPAPNAADGIRAAVADAAAWVDVGDLDAAAERFIDYWMGEGAWEQMPEQRQAPIRTSIRKVRQWGDALTHEPAPLSAFRDLHVPVLLMMGERTRSSARAVARLLAGALPWVRCVEFPGLGHMGPVTHPEVVNAAIESFLADPM